MPRLRHFLLLLITVIVAPLASFAQRVYWDPPGGRLGIGKTEPVSLVFEDCSPAEGFRLPAIQGLDFGEPSQSQQTSVINFQMTMRVVLTYPVRASEKGTVSIPAFDALTNKGRIAVGEVRFEIGEAGIGPAGIAISDIVSSEVKPARTTLWTGEVVDFEYLLGASTRYNVSLASEPEWNPAGLVLEPFGEAERADATVANERRQAVRYRTRGLFTQPGQLTLDPVRQLVNVQTGERAVGFFSQPRIEQFTVASNSPSISVRPLPQPAPAGFGGAVGSFKLESTIVPQTARIGEPITWTLTLSGTGNWTAGLGLPEREVSSDFQVVQPKTRTEMDDGRLFQGRMIEDAVLVPTVAGTYSLGPVALTYFDTAAGQYRTQIVPAVSVRIDPVPAGYNPAVVPHTSGEPATPGLPGAAVAAPLSPLPGDLAPAPQLPGDPLPVGTSAAMPRHLSVGWLVIPPIAAPLLCWFSLAVFQATRTDSSRDRRRALRELRRLMRDVSRHGAAPERSTLERWRTLVARVWSIRRATPTAEDLAAAVASTRGASRPDEWLVLWREAELAMFSAQDLLPHDWITRAASTARTTRIQSGLAWWPNRSGHWAPHVAQTLLVIACTFPGQLWAAEARDVYRTGEFDQARDAWSAHLRRHPEDWAAHYNVALASAQLDAWAEANAHAASATLLRPRSTLARQQLRLAATHLNGVDPMIRRMIEPVWHDRAAFWLSPGEWQNLLVGGSIVLGLALLALVVSLHVREYRAATRAAGQAMLAVGAVVVIAALLALSRYGPLADPQAAMVVTTAQLQSIPSDIAEKQKSVPIASGTVVVIERSFLAWHRVRGRGDAAGWIRREALVPFYLPLPADPADE